LLQVSTFAWKSSGSCVASALPVPEAGCWVSSGPSLHQLGIRVSVQSKIIRNLAGAVNDFFALLPFVLCIFPGKKYVING